MDEVGSSSNEPLLRIENLVVEFPAGRGRRVHAVSGVSFHQTKGETLGLVGESGCGKSSLAGAIMQLPGPTAGRVMLAGAELTTLDRQSLRLLRSRFQMIFQDPVASLNPIRTVGESIAAPLRAIGRGDPDERKQRAKDSLLVCILRHLPAWRNKECEPRDSFRAVWP